MVKEALLSFLWSGWKWFPILIQWCAFLFCISNVQLDEFHRLHNNTWFSRSMPTILHSWRPAGLKGKGHVISSLLCLSAKPSRRGIHPEKKISAWWHLMHISGLAIHWIAHTLLIYFNSSLNVFLWMPPLHVSGNGQV